MEERQRQQEPLREQVLQEERQPRGEEVKEPPQELVVKKLH